MKPLYIILASILVYFPVPLKAETLNIAGEQSSGWQYFNGSIKVHGTTVINATVNLDLAARDSMSFEPGFRVAKGGILRAAVSPDSDNDLILDIIEVRSVCLDPNLSDTDDDGIIDGNEDINQNGIHELALHETSACNPDTDGDLVNDGIELTNNTNPLVFDSGDKELYGMLATAEYYINGAIYTQGSTIIPNGEKIDMIAQTSVTFKPGFNVKTGGILRAGTSPDTDLDLILDTVEIRSGCENPNLKDTDNDGLLDSQEDINRNGVQDTVLAETSPCDVDSDDDRIPDGWEVANNLDPLVDDTNLDPDKDNLINYLEYYFKSDPQNAASLPPKGSYYEYDVLGRIKKIIRIK